MFQAFLVYACGIFGNTGNYKGMGDVKFVPNLDQVKFEAILKASKVYETQNDVIEGLWTKCAKAIFNLTDQTKCLGFNGQGVTTYFSDNCTKEDSVLVNEWLKSKKIEGYIARTFKEVDASGQTTYEIKIASVKHGNQPGITAEPETYKGVVFKITRGDYSKLLQLVNSSLAEALKYAANDNESKAINKYIESFLEGDLEAHKDATRCVLSYTLHTCAPYAPMRCNQINS